MAELFVFIDISNLLKRIATVLKADLHPKVYVMLPSLTILPSFTVGRKCIFKMVQFICQMASGFEWALQYNWACMASPHLRTQCFPHMCKDSYWGSPNPFLSMRVRGKSPASAQMCHRALQGPEGWQSPLAHLCKHHIGGARSAKANTVKTKVPL